MSNLFADIVMIAWIPVVLGFFATMKPRTAVLTAFVTAWLLLPLASYKPIEGLPVFDKMSATCLGVLMGVVLFDFARLRSFSPRVVDLPMLIWCLTPFASSLSNNLGAYDGISAAFRQTVTWGLPYFIGRIYFTSAADISALAKAILIGGLVYVPLCLCEIRMSPQLHASIYGFAQHDFQQTLRFGGYRPMVFMQHGLMVGMWMCMASLIGIWLWRAGTLTAPFNGHLKWMIWPLLVTSIACKSTGAIALMLAGLAVLFLSRLCRSAIPLWCLILVAPAALTLRVSGLWSGDTLVATTSDSLGADRAQSLKFRLDNENQLSVKAMQKPLLGWGEWGGARVYDETGRDVSVTDGLWIIALGNHGLIGLTALAASLLMPSLLVCRRLPVASWATPLDAALVAIAVVAALSMIDDIPNAMINPVYTVVVGAVTARLITPQTNTLMSGVRMIVWSNEPLTPLTQGYSQVACNCSAARLI